jgi:hypothetical protein
MVVYRSLHCDISWKNLNREFRWYSYLRRNNRALGWLLEESNRTKVGISQLSDGNLRRVKNYGKNIGG